MTVNPAEAMYMASLVPSPTPIFSSLVVSYCKQRKSRCGTGNKAIHGSILARNLWVHNEIHTTVKPCEVLLSQVFQVVAKSNQSQWAGTLEAQRAQCRGHWYMVVQAPTYTYTSVLCISHWLLYPTRLRLCTVYCAQPGVCQVSCVAAKTILCIPYCV